MRQLDRRRMAAAGLLALLLWPGLPTPARAQEADPPARALLAEGLVARTRGQLERAATLFEAGLAHDSANVPLWVELGVTRSWRGDLGGADAAFRTALVHDAGSPGARLGRARVAAWRGDLAAARDLYQPLLDDTATRIGAMTGLAATEAAALNRPAAQAWYRLALFEDPGNREALEGLDRVSRIQRTEWRLGLNGSTRGDGDRHWSLETGVVHRLRPDLTLQAGYQASAEEGSLRGVQNQGTDDPRRWAHAGRFGVRWQPATRIQVGTELTLARTPNGSATFVGLDASGRFAGPARLTVGVRPGRLSGEVTELLTWAGISGVQAGIGRLEGQVFRATDSRGTRSTALAGWWNDNLGGRLDLRAGAIRGWSERNGFVQLQVDGTLLRTPAGAVSLGLGWFRGAYRRTSVSVAVTRGW